MVIIMKLIQIYWMALTISGLCYLAFWFAPYTYSSYSPELQTLLAYSGLGAWYKLPAWFDWSYFILTLIAYVGMMSFRKIFLWLFVLTFVLSIVMEAATGATIITGMETFIIDTSTALASFVIGLAFFSPLKDRFR